MSINMIPYNTATTLFNMYLNHHTVFTGGNTYKLLFPILNWNIFFWVKKDWMISRYIKSQKKFKLPPDGFSRLYPLPSGNSFMSDARRHLSLVCITTRKHQAKQSATGLQKHLSATKPISQIKPSNWTQETYLQMN